MFKLVEFEQGESVDGIFSLKSIVTMNSDLPERYSSFIFYFVFGVFQRIIRNKKKFGMFT